MQRLEGAQAFRAPGTTEERPCCCVNSKQKHLHLLARPPAETERERHASRGMAASARSSLGRRWLPRRGGDWEKGGGRRVELGQHGFPSVDSRQHHGSGGFGPNKPRKKDKSRKALRWNRCSRVFGDGDGGRAPAGRVITAYQNRQYCPIWCALSAAASCRWCRCKFWQRIFRPSKPTLREPALRMRLLDRGVSDPGTNDGWRRRRLCTTGEVQRTAKATCSCRPSRGRTKHSFWLACHAA